MLKIDYSRPVYIGKVYEDNGRQMLSAGFATDNPTHLMRYLKTDHRDLFLDRYSVLLVPEGERDYRLFSIPQVVDAVLGTTVNRDAAIANAIANRRKSKEV